MALAEMYFTRFADSKSSAVGKMDCFRVISRTLQSARKVNPDGIVVAKKKDVVAPFLPSRWEQQEFIWWVSKQPQSSVLIAVFGARLHDLGNCDSRTM